MALFNKVRHKFGHRWMPFFLPVIASLLYVLFAVLFVPDDFSSRAEGSGTDNDSLTSPNGSATSPGDAAARLARRRSPRAGARTIAPTGGPGIVAPGQAPAAPIAPPPVAPASPDGAD